MGELIKTDNTGIETFTRSCTHSMVDRLVCGIVFRFLGCALLLAVFMYVDMVHYGSIDNIVLPLCILMPILTELSFVGPLMNKDDMVEEVTLDYDHRKVIFKYTHINWGGIGCNTTDKRMSIPFDHLTWVEHRRALWVKPRVVFYDENDKKLTWVENSLGWTVEDSTRLKCALEPFPQGD